MDNFQASQPLFSDVSHVTGNCVCAWMELKQVQGCENQGGTLITHDEH